MKVSCACNPCSFLDMCRGVQKSIESVYMIPMVDQGAIPYARVYL